MGRHGGASSNGDAVVVAEGGSSPIALEQGYPSLIRVHYRDPDHQVQRRSVR